jgi:type IV secretion system protein VirB4
VTEFNDHSKTIRKNEGIIGFITQNGWDLLQSAMAETIKQNVPTKEFFGDTGANEETLIGGFSLTPKEFHIVKYILPAMRHAFLKKMPGQSLIWRDDMSAIGGKVTVLSDRRDQSHQ